MSPEPAKAGLDAVAAAARGSGERGLPPVHLWNPAHCGDIDIVIRRDGTWWHEGAPIGRPALVRLFSTVLRKDPDGFHLVTPAEKMRITVEDAPFVAALVEQAEGDDGPALTFTTNVGDMVVAGPDHPIRVQTAPDGEPRPYVHVRADLEALIGRSAFYDLVAWAVTRDTPAGPQLGVWSNGAWFALGPPDNALGEGA
jgi:hypothetical protein